MDPTMAPAIFRYIGAEYVHTMLTRADIAVARIKYHSKGIDTDKEKAKGCFSDYLDDFDS
jgi:hypothetical protein